MIDKPQPAQRAAIYVRVSTGRQAENDLSIPDQISQLRTYAEKNNISITNEFVESGASARDDQRHEFQKLMELSEIHPPPFDVIIVHSMSRFFRDEMYYTLYTRQLEKRGIKVVSITQDFGTGEGAELAQRVMALADELHSREIAKHVKRTMRANARQGYFNGSRPPLGYKAVVVEMRGNKPKKKLDIDTEMAEIVRLAFRLYADGDGSSGPMGIKNITVRLNQLGYRTPCGKRFHISYVQKILRDERYVGRWYYGKFNAKKEEQPRDEWIEVQIPPIIEDTLFQRVQIGLTERNPKRTAPRIVNSPVLLSGVAHCACGLPLLRATGKGGAYKYYKCSGTVKTGICDAGINAVIPASELDDLVLDGLLQGLLTPERVQRIIAEVVRRQAMGAVDASATLPRLQRELAKSERRLRNLFDAIADGIDRTDIVVQAVHTAESERQRLLGLIANQKQLARTTIRELSLEEAELTATALKEKLVGSAPALKRRLIRSFVHRVTVGHDVIEVVGLKAQLVEVVTGTPRFASSVPRGQVPTFERDWQAG